MGKKRQLLAPIELEQRWQRLKGSRIEKVEYAEMEYSTGHPGWSAESSEFDSLDFGVNLTMDNGQTLAIEWGSEYAHYGISLQKGSLNLKEEGVRFWPASECWQHVLGVPIKSVCFYWSWWTQADSKGVFFRKYFPQDVQIGFESGASIVASVLEFRNDSEPIYAADHITIFFRQEDLKTHGLCDHGPHLASHLVPWP